MVFHKMKNTFKEIFIKYDTDKTDSYGDAYEECFTPIRNDIKLIFEIGVNRGGSVRAFKEFFPNAIIVGIDINPDCFFTDPDQRIKIEIGNANQKNFIDYLINKYGNPDIVIDDGSHCSSDMKDSFNLLYEHTRICYVIEDYCVQTPNFQNGAYINDGIPATIIIHDMINKLLFNQSFAKSIKIFYSICFFFK
jgi:hypothetical protein